MTLVDVHLEIDGAQTVTQGHAIAESARQRVMDAHHVLDVMTHVDPVSTEPAQASMPAATERSQ